MRRAPYFAQTSLYWNPLVFSMLSLFPLLQRLRLRLHGSKRLIGKLSKGFDFLGYRVVAGRGLRSSAESKRRFAEKNPGFP